MASALHLACLIACLSTQVSPAWASPEAEAELVQKTLPGLAGRRAAAQAAALDGADFFVGKLPLSRAFPDLAQAPLFQPGFVADAQRALQAGAQARAIARRVQAPADLSPQLQKAWSEAWASTLDQEASADAAVGRLLASIAGGLDQAPALSSPSTAAAEAGWAQAMASGAGSEPDTPAAAQASAASDAVLRLMRLRSAALRQMSVPGDQALGNLIAAELAVPVPGLGTAAERTAARTRLHQIRSAALLLPDAETVLARVDALQAAMGTEPEPQTQVVQAQRAAAEAKANAALSSSTQSASAQQEAVVAELRARIAEALQTEAKRHSDTMGRLESLKDQILGQQADLTAARAPLISNRAERIHSTLRSSRATVAEIRAERKQLYRITAEASQRAEEPQAGLQLDPAGLSSEQSGPLDSALSDLREVHRRVLSHLAQEDAQAMQLLREAKQVRDVAYSGASISVRSEVPVAQEIVREASEIPALLLATGRSYLDAIRALPSKVVETLGSVLIKLAELAALLALWSLVHRRAGEWIQLGLANLEPKNKPSRRPWESTSTPSWVVSGEIKAMRAPLTAVTMAAADLVLCLVLLSYLSPRVPLLALGAIVCATLAAARLLPRLVDLALITPLEVRPALRVTTQGVRDRTRWTVRLLMLWWGLDCGLLYAGEQVLDAPRMANTAHSAALVLLAGVALVGLYRWAPEIRAKIASDGDTGPLSTWIGAPKPSVIGTSLRAAVGACVIALGLSVALLTLVIEGRGGLGWLSAALARRQLNTDDDATRPRLAAAQLSAIEAAAMQTLRPPALASRIVSIFDDWEGEHRQGMVALTGDRGMGKSRVMSAVTQQLEAEHRVVCIQVPQRLTIPDQALLWLAEAAGLSDLSLDPTTDLELRAEAVGRALCALPQTVFIVDDTHRLFLRSVGCFDALKAVLIAMQASSNHHFWLCSFHGPAFSFLDGVRAVSHLAVFRARIAIEPTSGNELRRWLEAATAAAGPPPRYHALLQRPGKGAHLQRMLDRTSSAYWRLLAEASQGNPDVALDYWLSGLSSPDSESTEAVQVGLFSAPETGDLEALGDGALFTLTSLIIHDGATLEELHASLNLPEGEVRGTCRSLEAMGIIEDEDGDDTFEVTNRWLPAVERLLRRKSFLHRR
jgi:hypothetical protein